MNNRALSFGLLLAGLSLVGAGAAFYYAGSSAPAAEPAAAVASGTPADALPAPNPALPIVQVWKSPTCGCCTGWVEHMRRAGFQVQVQDVADLTPVKAEHGVAAEHQSCHTSRVDGYTIEGHVPADDIVRLLAERPQITGLAAPGMPVGSPGMEVGNQRDAYDVLAFTKGGETRVWASHP
jgi:hypothetical protein